MSEEVREETWLTVEQVAQHLQVTEETVRRWIRRGDLYALNVGGKRPDYRIRRDALDAFISKRYGPEGNVAA